MYDAIIIGCGPAGMTSAIYLARQNKKVLILEKETIGGQISSSPLVENYPGYIAISGSELSNNMFDQVMNLGVDFELEEVVEIKDGEVWVKNFHISEYAYSSIFNHNPDRPKKLLLHKEEIKRLNRKVEEKGYTLIPIEFYLKNGRVKVALGVCKGKKQYDKRATIKDRDLNRELQREFSNKLKG